MPTYTYTTLAAVRQQLADRLYDSGMVFWSSAELTLYIQESLQTWNAFTSFWRNDFTFNTGSGTMWYDLTDTGAMPNTLRPLTTTDQHIYTIMQYHLLEPAVWNPWTGASLQFTADDLLKAVQRRRDEILGMTGCDQNISTVGAVAGRITLNDLIIDVRRLTYLPNSPGTPSVVWEDDVWSEQSFDPLFTLNPAGIPFAYRMSTTPPLAFETNCPPAFAGNYELITTNADVALTTATPTIISIPDDWTHVLKWGALADLFGRESNAKDPLRQEYCEQRYQMGLKLLEMAPALLAMRIANVPLQVDAVRAADLYNPSWQSATPGQPTVALHIGLNLLAFSPPPNATYSMTATVVQNAPLPVADGDFIQLSRNDLDAIIDYAQHLAALKMGGAEFTNTMPLFRRFMDQAQGYNAKLDEMAEYTSVIYQLSLRQDQMFPVATPSDDSSALPPPVVMPK